MAGMAIQLLKSIENNEDSVGDYRTAVEQRYSDAVDSGCYTEVWPADFTIPMASADLDPSCDLGTLEADLSQAATDLDMDARTAAYNLGQFAMAEPTKNCDGN